MLTARTGQVSSRQNGWSRERRGRKLLHFDPWLQTSGRIGVNC